MDYLDIEGGRPLQGEARIQGSKNAALPILSAALLHRGLTVLRNCPDITDVAAMLELLKGCGCRARRERGTVILDARDLKSLQTEGAYAEKMRSSIMLLGSLLGRLGEVRLPYPGGCVIGKRPVDIHIAALRQMGAEIELEENGIHATCQKPHGAEIHLPIPSVGATENVILLAVKAEGETILHGAAREPEVGELCRFLRSAGARIRGEGTDCIVIEGKQELHDTEFTVMPDRIVAGTYMLLLAATGGSIRLWEVPVEQLTSLWPVLGAMGVDVRTEGDRVSLARQRRKPCCLTVESAPYPGFPTDLQSPLLAALAGLPGESRITERVFEARFKIVEELRKMGADITLHGETAWIRGKTLQGASLAARELRGGAALCIAAAGTCGESRISQYPFIARGYENIIRDLQGLGVVIH